MTTIERRSAYTAAQELHLPAGTSGDVELRHMYVSEADAMVGRLRAITHGRGGIRAGTYMALYRRGGLWMSNTPDEISDHRALFTAARQWEAKRVLIHGLGIGMAVVALANYEHVTHIDVVEIDPDVITLVGPAIVEQAAALGTTVVIHHGDAYTYRFPKGTTWDLAWHDIWQDLCTDNLPEMTKLHRRYGRAVSWQESWSRQELRRYQARENRRGGGWW